MHLFAAFFDLFRNIPEKAGVVVGAQLRAIQDVEDEVIGIVVDGAVGRVFMGLVLRVIGAGSVNQFQRGTSGVQERNIAFRVNTGDLFVAVQLFHDFQRKFRNLLDNNAAVIISDGRKMRVVRITNFGNGRRACLILCRHQLLPQKGIDQRGFAGTHRGDYVDGEDGIVYLFKVPDQLRVAKSLNRAIL